MNRRDLVTAASAASGLARPMAEKAVEAIFQGIADALKRGETVRLLGFGSFSVRDRAPLTARDPRSGAPIHIAAAKLPKFVPGTALRNAVNQ